MAIANHVPRLWLPLAVIGSTKEFVGKTRLQKIIFLIQVEARLDFYDFKRHYYGPFSRDLEIDVISHPELIEVEAQTSLTHPDRLYYVFRLTDKGRSFQKKLESMLERQTVQKVKDMINYLNGLSHEDLVNKVYSEYAPPSEMKLSELQNDLKNFMTNVRRIFMKYHNRQSLFILTILEYLDSVMTNIYSLDDVQRTIIAKVSAELLEKCKEAFHDVIPPVDSEKLRPSFLDIADTWGFLLEYCDKRGIGRNPFKLPPEELMTEEEALRLQKALKEIDLKQ